MPYKTSHILPLGPQFPPSLKFVRPSVTLISYRIFAADTGLHDLDRDSRSRDQPHHQVLKSYAYPFFSYELWHIPLDTNDSVFATTEYVPNHVTCQYSGGGRGEGRGLKITTYLEFLTTMCLFAAQLLPSNDDD